MGLRRIAKDLKIARPQVAFELVDDLKVRVSDPLAHLMRDDGDVDVGERVTIVPPKPGRLPAQHLGANPLNGQVIRASGEIRHFPFCVTSTGSVESAWIFQAIVFYPLRQ